MMTPENMMSDVGQATGAREIIRVPRRTLLGRLLCRVGLHRWYRSGTIQTVIPTGSALLIKSSHTAVLCDRRGCSARRDEVYERADGMAVRARTRR